MRSKQSNKQFERKLVRSRLIVLATILVLGLVCSAGSVADEAAGWFGISVSVDAGGFFLSPTVHSATILAVAPNSPAAAGGLRAGDEILEIEGLTVAGGKARDLQAALVKNVGESLRMRLRHSGGETYAAALTAVRKPAVGGNK